MTMTTMMMIHVNKKQTRNNSSNHIPLDLLFTICEYLDLEDQGKLRLVSRWWNQSLTGHDTTDMCDCENDARGNLWKMYIITQMKTLLRIQRSKCQFESRRWNLLTHQIEQLDNRDVDGTQKGRNVWNLTTSTLKQKIKRLYSYIRFKYILSPLLFPEIRTHLERMKAMTIPEFMSFEGVEQYDEMISKFKDYALDLVSTSNRLLELFTAFGETMGIRRTAKRFAASIFREITERYALLKQAIYRSLPYDWLQQNESYSCIEVAMRESFIELVQLLIKCDWRCRAMSVMHRVTHCLIAINDIQVMQLCRDHGLLKGVLFFKNSERYIFSKELLQFMLSDPSTFEFYIDYPISEHNCLNTIQTFVAHWGKCYVADDLLSRILIYKRPSIDQIDLTSWVLSTLHNQDRSYKLEIKYLLMSCRSEYCDARMVELLLHFGKWSKKDLTKVLVILINCIAGLPSLRYLEEKIAVLIKHGADVNAKWDRVGFDGATISINPHLTQRNMLGALGIEVRDGCRWGEREWSIIFDIVKLLVESGIDLERSYEQVVQIWSISIIDNICPLQYIRPIFKYFKQCRETIRHNSLNQKEYSATRSGNSLRGRISKVA